MVKEWVSWEAPKSWGTSPQNGNWTVLKWGINGEVKEMEQSLNFSFSKSAGMSSKLRDHVKEADVVVHAHNPQTRVTDILAIQTRQISKHLPMSEWYQKTRLVTEELHSRLLQLFYVMLYLTDIPSRPGLTFFLNFFEGI